MRQMKKSKTRAFATFALAALMVQAAPSARANAAAEAQARVDKITEAARTVTPQAVQGAKATAALMSKAAKAIEKANKAGEWTELAHYVGTLKKLSQAAEAIGFIGSAANILLTMNMPSDADRIISEIKSVDAHLTRLGEHIDDEFEKLNARDDWRDVKNQTSPHLSSIDAVNDDWANYQTAVRRDTIKGPQLAGRSPADLHDAAKALADSCRGANNKAAVFDAVIEYSRGDVALVLQQGQLMMLRIADAQRNYAALVAYENAGDASAPINLLQDAAELSATEFQPYLSSCYNAMEAAIRRIADRSEIGALITKQVQDEISDLPKSGPAGWAAHLGARLEARYPFYEFLVLSYEPVRGADNHYHRYFRSGSTKKYRITIHGIERNFAVAWARRSDRLDTAWASGCGPKLSSLSGRSEHNDYSGQNASAGSSKWIVSYNDGGVLKTAYKTVYSDLKTPTPADLWKDLVKPICGSTGDADFFWIGRNENTSPDVYATAGAGLYHGASDLAEHYVLYPRRVAPLRFEAPADQHRIYLTSNPDRCIAKAAGQLRIAACDRNGGADLARRFSFVDDVFLQSDETPDQCLAIEGGKPVIGREIVLKPCDPSDGTRRWRHVEQVGVFMSAARGGRGVCLGKAEDSDRLVTRKCGFEDREDIQFEVERAL